MRIYLGNKNQTVYHESGNTDPTKVLYRDFI